MDKIGLVDPNKSRWCFCLNVIQFSIKIKVDRCCMNLYFSPCGAEIPDLPMATLYNSDPLWNLI